MNGFTPEYLDSNEKKSSSNICLHTVKLKQAHQSAAVCGRIVESFIAVKLVHIYHINANERKRQTKSVRLLFISLVYVYYPRP